MQLDDLHQNRVPTTGGAFPPATGNHFTPCPLSHTAIALLKWSLERNQLRRSVYRARHVRAYIDGEAHVALDLEGGVSKSFQVPLSASYLEIFGDDSEGDLLLGVFFLLTPAENRWCPCHDTCRRIFQGPYVTGESLPHDQLGD